jgi:hypothetical protein
MRLAGGFRPTFAYAPHGTNDQRTVLNGDIHFVFQLSLLE